MSCHPYRPEAVGTTMPSYESKGNTILPSRMKVNDKKKVCRHCQSLNNSGELQEHRIQNKDENKIWIVSLQPKAAESLVK